MPVRPIKKILEKYQEGYNNAEVYAKFKSSEKSENNFYTKKL